MNLKTAAWLLCAFLACLTSDAAAENAASTQGPFHIRLIWTENPQNQATVSWSTAEASNINTVHYDVSPHTEAARYAFKVDAHLNGRFSSDKPELHYHHATLKELKPGTVYHFVVRTDRGTSKSFHFKTAPASDEDFSIIFGGDSRSDPSARREVNRMIAQLAEQDRVLAFAHGGDFVASGKKLDQWNQWLSDHELTVTDKGKMLPLIPARGNHESSGPLYDEVFGFPGVAEGNYFFTELSPEVFLITLNTNISTGGDQKEFLETALKQTKGKRWKLAQYHRPLYPAVKSPATAKKFWAPLFDEYGLDLACEADGHNIKRTPPIRDDKIHPDGVVYIGEGGLGVGQRSPKTDRWYLKSPGTAGKGHHIMLIDFKRTSLRIRTILLSGKLFDDYTMKAKRRVGK